MCALHCRVLSTHRVPTSSSSVFECIFVLGLCCAVRPLSLLKALCFISVHRPPLKLLCLCCSWRGPTLSSVAQKEATQRRHEEFSKLLTQDNEVGHSWTREDIWKNIFRVSIFMENVSDYRGALCHKVSCDSERLQLLNRPGTNESTKQWERL